MIFAIAGFSLLEFIRRLPEIGLASCLPIREVFAFTQKGLNFRQRLRRCFKGSIEISVPGMCVAELGISSALTRPLAFTAWKFRDHKNPFAVEIFCEIGKPLPMQDIETGDEKESQQFKDPFFHNLLQPDKVLKLSF
ncbi:MAG: hypothetical protein P8X96_13880 [Desulfobacteraceae bacterium]